MKFPVVLKFQFSLKVSVPDPHQNCQKVTLDHISRSEGLKVSAMLGPRESSMMTRVMQHLMFNLCFDSWGSLAPRKLHQHVFFVSRRALLHFSPILLHCSALMGRLLVQCRGPYVVLLSLL